jgi:hypothetical protein
MLIITALSTLLSLLVFIAGVVLSFTGRYPTSMFELGAGHRPLGPPRRRVRGADDRRIPAVPGGQELILDGAPPDVIAPKPTVELS